MNPSYPTTPRSTEPDNHLGSVDIAVPTLVLAVETQPVGDLVTNSLRHRGDPLAYSIPLRELRDS